MNKTIQLIIMIGVTFVGVGTAVAQQPLVQPRGTDSTFDFLTWNIHEFPGLVPFRTIDTLAALVRDLDVDMIAFQEVSDTNAFYQLLGQLPGWNGLFAPDEYPDGAYHKTAVIWRTDRASVTWVEQLFVGYPFQFPRPPIHVTGSVQFSQYQFDFNLIVLHLKASHDNESRIRRRAAIVMLKAYLDNTIPNAPDQDWIVAGDYNDELEDPENENVFWPLLTDSLDYRFLTLPMAGDPYWSSYPFLNSLIDHIMISSYANEDYGGGRTITLRLDDEYSNYHNRISDHRPVMAQFSGYYTSVADSDPPLPNRDRILGAFPNPFNGSVNLALALPHAGDYRLEIYDILGRHISTVLNDYYPAGRYQAPVNADNWGSGIFFVRLVGGGSDETLKLILLK